MRLLLVDLSSLFRPLWEMSGDKPDVDYASKATVARVHELSQGFDGVAIACDSRKSWRKELCPTYKAQRPAQEEPMYHQLALAKEQLAADGFPVWEAEGFEADDVIAAAVKQTETDFGHQIVIASSDKDLCQLVTGDVRVKSLRTGDLMGPAEVEAKFGVPPSQMLDLLVLWGDASDGIKGVKDIGQKRGVELLKKFGSVAHIYANIGDSCTKLGLTPSMFTNLKEGMFAADMARKLITLRTDVELPFADIFRPRVAKERPKASWDERDNPEDIDEDDMQTVDGEIVDETTGEVGPQQAQQSRQPAAVTTKPTQKPSGAAALRADKSVALVTVDWNHSLEPANLSQAMNLATALHASKLFQAYGSPEAVLAVILAGREFGIGAMSALKGFHIIDGKPSMSADLMAAIVKRSPFCKQFEIIERTVERATIRVWRAGEEKPFDISYSVDDAKRAKTYKPGGNWEKDPAGMCVSRCKAIGARLKWEDLLGNVYTPEEMGREDLEEAA